MALHNRIKRLEEAIQKCQALEQWRRYDPAWEQLVDDPEWPALVRELFALLHRLMASGCADMLAIRQGMIADDRAREICCRLSEIAGGLQIP